SFEGVSIGAGAAIQPGLGFMVALAILIDNVSEALSIGELIRDRHGDSRRDQVRRVLQWTGLIGVSQPVRLGLGRLVLPPGAAPIGARRSLCRGWRRHVLSDGDGS